MMSRISEKNRETVKRQIYDVLNEKYQSVFSIAEKVARSWTFVNTLLNEMNEEPEKWKGLKKEVISNLICWKKSK